MSEPTNWNDALNKADLNVYSDPAWDEMRAELTRLQAEVERLREALEDGVALIKGDAASAPWRRECLDFIAKARAALTGEQDG